MINRRLEEYFLETLAEYPVVTVFGPRQSGKTTLAKKCCPDFEYVNLEDLEERELAVNDYKAFFSRHQPPLIIDEIQRAPELVSAVQVIVEKDRRRSGQFVLTGSQQSELASAIDESLAGRTGVLELLPLSLAEIAAETSDVSTDELLLRGLMPELWATRKRPTAYYRNYFRTYVERDVRRLVNIRDLIVFERFMTLLAGRVGQIVNLSSLASETGVSAPTISGWLAVLEASFLIFRLPPYYSNIAKRVVKSPKIYFTEPGLATYLLGLESASQIARDPLRGQLFENLAVMEAYKQYSHRGRDRHLAFLRTEKGFEIDLLLKQGTRLQPVEIKSAMTFNKSLVHNLETYMKEESAALNPTLVYDGTALDRFGDYAVRAVNLRDWAE